MEEDIDIEEHVDDFMGVVHEHELYNSKQPPEVTVAFLEALSERLREEADHLREEHGVV